MSKKVTYIYIGTLHLIAERHHKKHNKNNHVRSESCEVSGKVVETIDSLKNHKEKYCIEKEDKEKTNRSFKFSESMLDKFYV